MSKSKRQAQIIIVSDRAAQGIRKDQTADKLIPLLENQGFTVLKPLIIPDDQKIIADSLVKAVDEQKIDLIVTSGGTGLGPRDVTVEATREVMEKEVPGMAEYMRLKSVEIVKTALLSRGMVVSRDKSLIVNLPGSPKGAMENLTWIADILHHALDMLIGESH